MRVAKCEILADGQGRRREHPGARPRFTYPRSRSATSKGVNCSDMPFGLASTQRMPASSGISRQGPRPLASAAARRAQLAVPAPAPNPSSSVAMSPRAVSSSRQRVQKRRADSPTRSARRRRATCRAAPRDAFDGGKAEIAGARTRRPRSSRRRRRASRSAPAAPTRSGRRIARRCPAPDALRPG
jgi:hypothetical protein